MEGGQEIQQAGSMAYELSRPAKSCHICKPNIYNQFIEINQQRDAYFSGRRVLLSENISITDQSPFLFRSKDGLVFDFLVWYDGGRIKRKGRAMFMRKRYVIAQ